MKTFKNTKAGKWDGETTLVMFAQGEQAPARGDWAECDALEIDLTPYIQPLQIEAGIRYFGRL